MTDQNDALCPKPTKLGTLSFAKDGDHMVMSTRQRIEIMERLIRQHQPDLFITAGYAVGTMQELCKLSRRFRKQD